MHTRMYNEHYCLTRALFHSLSIRLTSNFSGEKSVPLPQSRKEGNIYRNPGGEAYFGIYQAVDGIIALFFIGRKTNDDIDRLFRFWLDASPLKFEGLMKIPTQVNTEDATHPGLQQARKGIINVVIHLLSLSLHRLG